MDIHLDRALSLAREAHEGQTRRHGAPYIQHPAAVKTFVEDIGVTAGIEVSDATRAVALLHDVIEDNTVGIDHKELAARFGDDVARRVDLLTKTGKGPEVTAAYYQKLDDFADDALRLVKVCDRLHNLSELHLAPDLAKLEKYVTETLEHVVPLAAHASQLKTRRALVAALVDALRAAARAQGAAPPSLVVDSLLPGGGGGYTASWESKGRDISISSSARVGVPHGIYAIVDVHGVDANINGGAAPMDLEELEERLRELCVGGVALVQLRAKHRTDRDILRALEVTLGVCRPAHIPVIVNDRPDLCVAAGADGVHVGQTDLPPLQARRIVGDVAYVGTSTHGERDFDAARGEGGADHIAVGPVFDSTTKSGHAPVVGVDMLERRVARSRFPVVAIGGVTNTTRVYQCAKAGASLVAAVSALDGPGARIMCRRMSLVFAATSATLAL